MNWAEFKNKFSRAHVPQGLVTRMRDEFRELKQDRMSVVEYRDKFLTLSRYAPDDADTEEKKKERFLNGLHDEMQPILVNIPFTDLEALVDSAIRMEGKLKQVNENRKRRMFQQGGPSNPPEEPDECTFSFCTKTQQAAYPIPASELSQPWWRKPTTPRKQFQPCTPKAPEPESSQPHCPKDWKQCCPCQG